MAGAESQNNNDAPPGSERLGAVKDESDLDPAAFLKSVRELSEKREREDAERYRKLEEEVQKGREARAARRAERARSISPQKAPAKAPAPSTSTTPSRPPANASLVTSPPMTTTPPSSSDSPSRNTRNSMAEPEQVSKQHTGGVPDFKGFGSIKRSSATSRPAQPTMQHQDENATSSPSASNLARSGTLSWNQRPRSRPGGSRPQSTVATEKGAINTSNTSTEESQPSRDQIAASLGARDPNWFKQTADRGIGNAAYRRSKDDGSEGIFSARQGLPGMSRETVREPDSASRPNFSDRASMRSDRPTANAVSPQSEIPTRGGSVRESVVSSESSRSSALSSGKPDLKSLIAADEDQQKASPSFDGSSVASADSVGVARAFTMSSSQARLTGPSERPSSPTKGMGGFVQSAMMKRSDSQNKRWSAQPGPSPSRTNSALSGLGGAGGLQGSYSMPRLEPSPDNMELRQEPASRPGSASNNDLSTLSLDTTQANDGFVKPALPHHSRSKSVASNYSASEDAPGSPSKRFSPSKSSWLESSLTKPESPKQPTPFKNAQPSWMADLAKAKAQRASQDLSQSMTSPKAEDNDRARPPSRPGSPLKPSPFGQSMLRRSESRTDPTHASGIPDAAERGIAQSPFRPASPDKSTPAGRSMLRNTPQQEQLATPQSTSQTHTVRPLRLADKFTASPAAPSSSLQTTSVDTLRSERSQDQGVAQTAGTSGQPESTSTGATADGAGPQLTSASEEPSRQRTEAAPSTPPASKSDERPPAQQPISVRPGRSQTLKSVPSPTKPDASPQTTVDFRSQLKSRPRAETKSLQEPEFLSKFGNLRKTQQEKYVAPDVLKDNILRGKGDLSKTDGPQRTTRRDELRESLLARKDDIKKTKEEGRELPGQAHERKTSANALPTAAPKPEALARRELLGRSDSARSVQSWDRTREATPEALARHRSLKQKPTDELKADIESTKSSKPSMSSLEAAKTSASRPVDELENLDKKRPSETSKLASRFHPGLANILAKGPPSRPESPAILGGVTANGEGSADPPAPSAPLEDMRKGRAKGPKRKKAATKTETTASRSENSALPTAETVVALEQSEQSSPNKSELIVTTSQLVAKQKPLATSGSAASVMVSSLSKSPRPISTGPYLTDQAPEVLSSQSSPAQSNAKPRALPGSAASLMTASLQRRSTAEQGLQQEQKLQPSSKQALSSASVTTLQEAQPSRPSHSSDRSSAMEPAAGPTIPDFKGFGASRKVSQPPDEDKENTIDGPSVKATGAQWDRRASPVKEEVPSPVQLPTKKDEEAAMRSVGLLASRSKPPTPSKNGLGISVVKHGDKSPASPSASAGLPPKPAKSSRIVSGQLAEASPNQGSTSSEVPRPSSSGERTLTAFFGTLPSHNDALAIDTQSIIEKSQHVHVQEDIKTLRNRVHVVAADGSTNAVPPQEEYTFFDESTYLCTHAYVNARDAKSAQIFLWAGDAAPESIVEAATTTAKKISKENGSAQVQIARQGQESPDLLRALGGIFVTRRGSREHAPKQYMLCGRKHLGHIVFDEVDFSIDSLCSGFVYLVSYPVSLQQTKLYLWKGQGSSAEETSAARLAAMDLSETGEIIEVDGGVEFTSFLKIFGPSTTKWNVPKPSELWQQKAAAPDKFHVRLYRPQQAEVRPSLLTSLWNRRPSWRGSPSPARSPDREAEKFDVEVKQLSPFTQAQLEAEGVYLLDAYSQLYILIGPLFGSQPETIRNRIFGQTLLFASDYAALSAELENRPAEPKCAVLFSGTPRDIKMLFRHWDEAQGLWGTAGLMAGSTMSASKELRLVPLEEVLAEVCRR